MPRKRIIDPEFWSDEEIGKWPFEARLFYIGLWNFADDEGRLKAHPSLLKSQIFPYETEVDIETLKNIVSGKVDWYSVDNSQYGNILNFLKYQRIDRPTPSKIPTRRTLDEHSTNTRGHLAPKLSKEKLREVKTMRPPGSVGDFEDIWSKYPKKDGRKAAERSFKASVKTEQDYADIQKALKNYLDSSDVARGFIKNGSTWFNNWQDWINYTDPAKPYDDVETMLRSLEK